MSIDHEAAKLCAEGMMRISNGDSDIAEAYLDLHDQLTAERARVKALVELVREIHSRSGTTDVNELYRWIPRQLDRIMEGRHENQKHLSQHLPVGNLHQPWMGRCVWYRRSLRIS